MRATTIGLLWAAFFSALIAMPCNAIPDEVIASVLVRQDAVYASCSQGLYRASKTDKKWVQLKVPDRMPFDGHFAEEASPTSSLYYYTPKWTGWKMPAADTKTFGLYRGDESGGKWNSYPQNTISSTYSCMAGQNGLRDR